MTTRSRGAAAVVALCLLAAPACQKEPVRTVKTVKTVEKPQPVVLSSAVRMGDPAVATQLVSGFYGIEANAWRWTAQKFAVDLRPPAQAATKGAEVEFHFTIPPTQTRKLGSMTLSGTVGGTALAPQTYTRAGEYTYRRDVPAKELTSPTVRVEFQLDKVMPPGDADKRELGIVALNAALVAK